MSISSDFSKNTLAPLQAGQTNQQAEQAFQTSRQKDAKVVLESADSNSTSDATQQRGKEFAESPLAATEPTDVADVNIKMRQLSVGLSFERSDDGQENVVKVIDQDTGDVVRQIPTEEFLEMSKRLDEIFGELDELKGNLVNSKV